jgi:hypothetical protein
MKQLGLTELWETKRVRGKNLRTCLLHEHQQGAAFVPAEFTQRLKDAGFVLESEACPVKIRAPFDRMELPRAHDNAAFAPILWRQWDE